MHKSSDTQICIHKPYVYAANEIHTQIKICSFATKYTNRVIHKYLFHTQIAFAYKFLLICVYAKFV